MAAILLWWRTTSWGKRNKHISSNTDPLETKETTPRPDIYWAQRKQKRNCAIFCYTSSKKILIPLGMVHCMSWGRKNLKAKSMFKNTRPASLERLRDSQEEMGAILYLLKMIQTTPRRCYRVRPVGPVRFYGGVPPISDPWTLEQEMSTSLPE